MAESLGPATGERPTRSVPCVLIELALESPPRVRLVASSETDHARIVDWLTAHPAYHDLTHRALALELAAKERRAA